MAAIDRIGKYCIVTNSDFDFRDSQIVVLDSNVLIDATNYYYGTGASSSVKEDLHSLFDSLLNVKGVNAAFALTETCRRRVNFDISRARKMSHAIYVLWNSDQERLRKMFTNRHAPINRDKKWRRGWVSQFEMDSVKCEIPEVVYLFYASFLRLIELYKDDSCSRDRCFKIFSEWQRDELGCVSLYPTAVARALLLGCGEDSGKARALLKVDKANLTIDQKAWNASWDCYLMFLLDGYRMGSPYVVGNNNELVGTFVKAALVTAKDQAWIDSMTDYVGTIYNGNVPLPLTENALKIRDDAKVLAQREYCKDIITCGVRVNNLSFNQVANTIKDIEARLNINPKTPLT